VFSGVLSAGSGQTPFSYVLTPDGVGSHRLLVMISGVDSGEGAGKCLEVQDDGSFTEVWSVPWFAPRGFVYLHPDGKSLLRIHNIDADKPLSAENYGSRTAFSFYNDGKLVKKILISEVVSEYSSFERVNSDYRIIKRVDAPGGFSMDEMGFPLYEDSLKEELTKASIFCVTTEKGERLFYTSLGKLINRLTKANPRANPDK
jgi:hypothetical protein